MVGLGAKKFLKLTILPSQSYGKTYNLSYYLGNLFPILIHRLVTGFSNPYLQT